MPISADPPPDIDEGEPDGNCTTDQLGRVTCKVGTNFCIDPARRLTSIIINCAQNMSARTPTPIGVWFVNGRLISNRRDGNKLPDFTEPTRINFAGAQISIPANQAVSRGNYTCQLNNVGGFDTDTETSFITDCSK